MITDRHCNITKFMYTKSSVFVNLLKIYSAMDKYEVERALDNLLAYLAGVGTRNTVSVSQLNSGGYPTRLVDILVSRGLAEYLTVNFSHGPLTFDSTVSVTPVGLWFHHSSGFVKEALQKSKEQKRFNFEGYKLGWDGIASLLALAISLWSLYIAAMK